MVGINLNGCEIPSTSPDVHSPAMATSRAVSGQDSIGLPALDRASTGARSNETAAASIAEQKGMLPKTQQDKSGHCGASGYTGFMLKVKGKFEDGYGPYATICSVHRDVNRIKQVRMAGSANLKAPVANDANKRCPLRSLFAWFHEFLHRISSGGVMDLKRHRRIPRQQLRREYLDRESKVQRVLCEGGWRRQLANPFKSAKVVCDSPRNS